MAQGNYFDRFDQPGQGFVPPLPESPGERADRERDDAAANRDTRRTVVTERNFERETGNIEFQHTTKLANDYTSDPVVRRYRVAIEQLGKSLGTTTDPQGDLALTYAFAKAMDPDSVVRDQEQNMVIESQPWFQSAVQRAMKQFNMDGAGQYTDATRRRIRQQIINSVAQSNRTYNARRTFYRNQARHFKIDPQYVIGEHDGAQFRPTLQAYDRRSERAAHDPMAVTPQRGVSNEPRQMIPGTGGPSQMQRAQGETYSTPEDVAFAREIDSVYRGGGSVQDMIAVAQKYNRTPNLQRAAEWQRAIDYRDGTGEYRGQPGGFSPVLTPETGRRNFLEQAWGRTAGSELGASGIGVANALTMGGLDEMTGGINSLFTGNSAASEIAYADMAKNAAAAEHPGFYLGGNVAGAGMQALALGLTAPEMAAASVATLPRTIGTGAAYGGVNGALESNNDRLGGAALGAGVGAAGGPAGRYVIGPTANAFMGTRGGQAISNGVRAGVNRLGLFGGVNPTANVPAIAPEMRPLLRADLEAARGNLTDAARLGMPYSLADASPELRALGGAVTRKSVNARGHVENIVEPRHADQGERAVSAIQTRLSPTTNLAERRQHWRTVANQQARPLYEEAFQGGSTAPLEDQLSDAFNASSRTVAEARAAVAAAEREATLASARVSRAGSNVYANGQALPANRGASSALAGARQRLAQAEAEHAQVVEQLRRSQGDAASNAPGAVWNPRLQQFIDDPLSKAGLARGLEIQRLEALAEGRPFNPREYAVIGTDSAGNPIVGDVPNLRTLDAIKRGYDAILDDYPRDMRGNQIFDQRGRAITMAKQALVNELDSVTGGANGAYASARNAYGTFAELGETLGQGYAAAPRGIYARDIHPRLAGMTEAQLGEYRMGYATRLRDMVSDTNDSSDPYRLIFGGNERRNKIRTVFPEGADDFARQYELEQDMARTRYETVGGSPTAGRLQADAQLGDMLGAGLEMGADVMTGGGTSGLGMAVNAGRRLLTDTVRLGVGRRAERNAEALAPVLFNTNPELALSQIDEIRAMQALLDARRETFRRRGGLFGSMAPVGAALSYQGS